MKTYHNASVATSNKTRTKKKTAQGKPTPAPDLKHPQQSAGGKYDVAREIELLDFSLQQLHKKVDYLLGFVGSSSSGVGAIGVGVMPNEARNQKVACRIR